MRVEHIAPFDSRFNTTQFYIACAHINVSGRGGGKSGNVLDECVVLMGCRYARPNGQVSGRIRSVGSLYVECTPSGSTIILTLSQRFGSLSILAMAGIGRT
jgi:hypothetical protein